MNLPQRGQDGLRSFAVERQHDESGVSGTGIVLEGVVFSTGVVVIHWLTPPPHGSLNIFTSFEQFMGIHVGPHPTNRTRIHWDDGEVWEPGDYAANPSPWKARGALVHLLRREGSGFRQAFCGVVEREEHVNMTIDPAYTSCVDCATRAAP